MTGEYGTADRRPSDRVDVCIVGAGVAGAIVGNELATRGHDVLFLEAGERFPPPGERFDRQEIALRSSRTFDEVWNVGGARDRYSSTGKFDYPLNTRRVKGVGGTTLHWGGYTPRLHPKDFEMERRYGLARDWPISYETLRPYYATAERELGVAGADDNPFVDREESFPLPAFPTSHTDSLFASACDSLGIEVHTLPQARNSTSYDGRAQCQGFGTCSPVCPIGAKYSGDVHVRQAEGAGARVIDRAPVQRIEHDSTGETVEAVVYATPDGETHRQTARQFAIAAGGVETARLLLLSRSEQYPDGLANTSGTVGRYFMDHPYITMVGTVDEPGNPEPMGYNTLQSQALYDHEPGEPGSVMLTFDNVSPVDVVRPALRGGDANVWGDLADPLPGDKWGDELLETVRERAQSGRTRVKIHAAAEQLPRPESSVTLDRSQTDDHGNPVPDVSWRPGPHAREAHRHAAEVMRRIIRKMGGTVRTVNLDDPGPGGHQMGTTRMGTDPTESVIDPRLRTHDLDNLTLVSSSVFTTGGAVNPTLTIVALALRAADHLDEDL